mmetsp:Transcript_36113/g.90632  ORF Transcript_36113/g.90632 Transcript_36113/m.90632 type:complete len:218 (+) Transcript_36113:32-685(+)
MMLALIQSVQISWSTPSSRQKRKKKKKKKNILLANGPHDTVGHQHRQADCHAGHHHCQSNGRSQCHTGADQRHLAHLLGTTASTLSSGGRAVVHLTLVELGTGGHVHEDALRRIEEEMRRIGTAVVERELAHAARPLLGVVHRLVGLQTQPAELVVAARAAVVVASAAALDQCRARGTVARVGLLCPLCQLLVVLVTETTCCQLGFVLGARMPRMRC